jgi:hypothetical protein
MRQFQRKRNKINEVINLASPIASVVTALSRVIILVGRPLAPGWFLGGHWDVYKRNFLGLNGLWRQHSDFLTLERECHCTDQGYCDQELYHIHSLSGFENSECATGCRSWRLLWSSCWYALSTRYALKMNLSVAPVIPITTTIRSARVIKSSSGRSSTVVSFKACSTFWLGP